MQLLVKIEEGVPSGAPVTSDNLRQLFPDLPDRYLLAADLDGTGYATFAPMPRPQIDDPTLEVVEVAPTAQNSDGEWLQAWEVVDRAFPSPAEKDAAAAAYLEDRKARARAEVNNRRDRLEKTQFLYMGKLWNCDPESVRRIGIAVQAAQAAAAASQPFSIDWTLADNSTLTLTATDMMGAPVAMAVQGNALHVYARDLKDEIDACTSLAQLEAVDMTEGWPIPAITT